MTWLQGNNSVPVVSCLTPSFSARVLCHKNVSGILGIEYYNILKVRNSLLTRIYKEIA